MRLIRILKNQRKTTKLMVGSLKRPIMGKLPARLTKIKRKK